MLRVLHLTDPHLFADPNGALRGTVTYASLAAVIDHYRAGDWHADLAVVTGDVVQDDSREAYDHFCRLLGKLGIPVLCLPGNHDVPELMQATLSDPPFRYCESVTQSNWLIICLDSCVEGRAAGAVSADELTRLDAVLQSSHADNVMVCLHHPPVPMGSAWLDSVGLEKGDEVLRKLASDNRIRLAIFGHVHQEYESRYAGLSVIGTPSTCRQFAPGCEKFAIDDKPPAYRRFNLCADGSYDHELIWVA